MKFFVPAVDDKVQEQSAYSGIKRFLEKELGAQFDNRRCLSLCYIHNGKELHAQVGEIHSLNHEPVIAILHEPGRRLYHVCTSNRGVACGMSIVVGEHEVRSSVDFESE